MRDAPTLPETHLFVCANKREGSPLGDGCAERGDALYDALKREVATRRIHTRVWITRTHCLGICPARGATVAVYPEQRIITEVEASDAATLLDDAMKGSKG